MSFVNKELRRRLWFTFVSTLNVMFSWDKDICGRKGSLRVVARKASCCFNVPESRNNFSVTIISFVQTSKFWVAEIKRLEGTALITLRELMRG